MKSNNYNEFIKKFILTIMIYAPILLDLTKLTENKIIGSCNHKNITVDDMYKAINNCANLTEEEKMYIINENLYEDIITYINNEQRGNHVISLLNDYDILPMSDEEKISNPNTAGYYNRHQEPNHIYVRDYNGDMNIKIKSSISHEHIHSLQSFPKYKYIQEAITSLISNEYYHSGYSYINEQKRLKVLMEIIGPDPIWELCFSGNSINFESIINKYLSEQDANKLLSLFKEINNPNHKEIDQILGILYFNKYGEKIENDEIITAIYNNKVISRNYFNLIGDKDIIYIPVDIEEAERKGILETKYELVKKDIVHESEFSRDIYRGNINIKKVDTSNYVTQWDSDSNKIKFLVKGNSWEEYTYEEAVEIGYIYHMFHVEDEIISDNKEERDKLIEEGYKIRNTIYEYDYNNSKFIEYGIDKTLVYSKEIPTIRDKFDKEEKNKIKVK